MEIFVIAAVAILAIVLIVALGVGASAVIGAGAIAATSAAEEAKDEGREWAASWRGHEAVLRTRDGQHSLYLDGKLVAQQTSDGGATLEGRIDGTPVIGSIQRGAGLSASLHVDGAPVEVQRRPFGTAMAGVPSANVASGATAPEDPRWEAIEHLVAQVRPQGGEAAELAVRSQTELRALLLSIAEAEQANASHQTLTGREDERLRRLIDTREAQVGRLIDALRELHVGTVEKDASPDASARLLAALEVELAQRRE